jgi:WD40 repeat protein
LRIVSAGVYRDRGQNVQARLDYSLRLWDAATGRPIGRPLPAPDTQTVAFSRDGKHVISTSVDKGTARVWEVFAGWADALCAKLPRNPTEAEWRDWVSPNIAYACPCPGLPGPAACGAVNGKAAAAQ